MNATTGALPDPFPEDELAFAGEGLFPEEPRSSLSWLVAGLSLLLVGATATLIYSLVQDHDTTARENPAATSEDTFADSKLHGSDHIEQPDTTDDPALDEEPNPPDLGAGVGGAGPNETEPAPIAPPGGGDTGTNEVGDDNRPDEIAEPAPVPDPDSVPLADPATAVAELEVQFNAERAAGGCSNLVTADQLSNAAQAHNTVQGRKGQAASTGLGDGTPEDRVAAQRYPAKRVYEMVGMDFADATAAMNAWRLNPAHAETMRSCKYAHIGLDVRQRKGHTYWTVVFAAPTWMPV